MDWAYGYYQEYWFFDDVNGREENLTGQINTNTKRYRTPRILGNCEIKQKITVTENIATKDHNSFTE